MNENKRTQDHKKNSELSVRFNFSRDNFLILNMSEQIKNQCIYVWDILEIDLSLNYF